jgi:transposase
MPGRRMCVLEVREIVRRLRLGETERRIGRDLGVSRNTVAKYRAWAEERGFLARGDLPSAAELEEARATAPSDATPLVAPPSKAAAHREFIETKLREGVELRALHRLLVDEKHFDGSYSSLRRFAARLRPSHREAFLRVETGPGEEAQVDFGYAGLILDEKSGQVRRAWVFVMTLGFSRHQYVEIVFDQSVETWIGLHVRAFEWFGGVPRRIVIDNLRSAISRAVLHDAEAQRSYRDLAEHYGFLISPCRPRTPRHKGKVESGVHYVKRNALAGRQFAGRVAANEHLRRWAIEVAGTRIHGTTHEPPLERFARETLLPLPATRYEPVTWKRAKANRDCHVVFEAAYYSFPHRLVGEELWVCGGPHRLEIFHEQVRVACHERARRRGEWRTDTVHYPPGKLAGLLPPVEAVRTAAQAVGLQTSDFIERLLGQRPMDRLRGAQTVVRLASRYAPARLERACARAIAFDEIRVQTVKEILKKGLDLEFERTAEEETASLPRTSIFARPLDEIVGGSR